MSTTPNTTILLVDDEALVCRALARVLKSAGWDVQATTDPKLAIEYLETQPPPLAVISDHHMPEVTGLDVLAAAAIRAPSTTRLLTTGSPTKQMLADAINKSHVHYYVEKPVQMPQLLELMRKIADHHEKRQAPAAKPIRAPGVRGDELYDAARFLGEAMLISPNKG
ncbi:MAG TPA: response regulator [Myxococcota bacterium]